MCQVGGGDVGTTENFYSRFKWKSGDWVPLVGPQAQRQVPISLRQQQHADHCKPPAVEVSQCSGATPLPQVRAEGSLEHCPFMRKIGLGSRFL